MKKDLFISLALLMALSAVGCIGSSVKEPSEVTGITQSPTDVPDNDKTEAPLIPETDAPTSAPTEKPADEVTIEETVLVDKDGVKITAKSIDTKSLFGPELKLLIENDSGKNLTIQTRDVSINGYMISTLFSASIVSGKKSNDSITFMSSSLEDCGITMIADIELVFHVIESESYDLYFDSDPVVIKTSVFDGFEYSFDESGTLAYEGNGIKIIVKGLSEETLFGQEILVYVFNTNDKNVTVQVRDVSVNGFMLSAYFSCEVCPGKHAVDSITFLSSELEENSIETIEEVELSFHMFYSDTWKDIADSDPITIKF